MVSASVVIQTPQSLNKDSDSLDHWHSPELHTTLLDLEHWDGSFSNTEAVLTHRCSYTQNYFPTCFPLYQNSLLKTNFLPLVKVFTLLNIGYLCHSRGEQAENSISWGPIMCQAFFTDHLILSPDQHSEVCTVSPILHMRKLRLRV